MNIKFTQDTEYSGNLTIPSEMGLLTIARVTQTDTDRIAAAKRWLGSGALFGEREKFILNSFWDMFDRCPPKQEVTKVTPRHVTYS